MKVQRSRQAHIGRRTSGKGQKNGKRGIELIHALEWKHRSRRSQVGEKSSTLPLTTVQFGVLEECFLRQKCIFARKYISGFIPQSNRYVPLVSR